MDLNTTASVVAALTGLWLVWDAIKATRTRRETKARLATLIGEIAASSATTKVEALLVTPENEAAVELGVRKGILRTSWSGMDVYVSRKRH